ncbi:hypothetical protein HUG10_20755 (plasmid) [Halorarum halophilum]|uniref:Uncharacterized protein n=1 Tax=Halorarum halophilum TaxID=2743090 RepID=A0A7D5KYK2_9EURY|nr:hypothetical protein [Halobaculum halophilum]QLG30038.1 hypothetical protein HUG10_20755 [Halobaculum halophilum]
MVSDKKIALDIEGVCADTHAAAIERCELIDDVPDQYDFASPDQLDEYLDVSATIWEHEPEIVPPCDPDIADHVNMLRESHTVEVLTNRYGVDDQVQQWLNKYGIDVDGFQANPPTTKKEGFEKSNTYPNGFDYFIDDNPKLAFKVERLFLVDQSWNQNVDDDDEQVIRVGDRGAGALIEVVNDLYAGPVRE